METYYREELRRGAALLSQSRLLVTADPRALELAVLIGLPLAVLERATPRDNDALRLFDAWFQKGVADMYLLSQVAPQLCC